MYSLDNQNSLIVEDMAQVMLDYASIQQDIDETKMNAAALIAQKLDIGKVIGKPNLLRCVDPQTASDTELRELVIHALCFYTYSRLLRMFAGTFTDSGYVISSEATDKNVAKSVALEYSAIAEVYLTEVLDFLKIENEGIEDELVRPEKLTSSIRVFGGVENRASN
jgi:hypothetical protein